MWLITPSWKVIEAMGELINKVEDAVENSDQVGMCNCCTLIRTLIRM